jgi:hypothetical protein
MVSLLAADFENSGTVSDQSQSAKAGLDSNDYKRGVMIGHMNVDVAVRCSYRSSQDAACSDSFEVYFDSCCIVVCCNFHTCFHSGQILSVQQQVSALPQSRGPPVYPTHASYCPKVEGPLCKMHASYCPKVEAPLCTQCMHPIAALLLPLYSWIEGLPLCWKNSRVLQAGVLLLLTDMIFPSRCVLVIFWVCGHAVD